MNHSFRNAMNHGNKNSKNPIQRLQLGINKFNKPAPPVPPRTSTSPPAETALEGPHFQCPQPKPKLQPQLPNPNSPSKPKLIVKPLHEDSPTETNSYSLNRYSLQNGVILRNKATRSNSSVEHRNYRYSKIENQENISPVKNFGINFVKTSPFSGSSDGSYCLRKIDDFKRPNLNFGNLATSPRQPLQNLTLGRPAAKSFSRKKFLLDKGQNLALKISAKMCNLVENSDQLESLENLENFVEQMEHLADKNCRDPNSIHQETILSKNREIEKLKSEKQALLDEILKFKHSNSSSLFE